MSTAVEPASLARRSSRPCPVRTLSASTGAPRAASSASATAFGRSSQASAFVRTTIGVAPLSHDTSRKRSSRRAENAWSKAFTTTTMSTLAATTGEDVESSGMRRSSSERRSSTAATPPSPSVTIQSPTASALSVATRRSPAAPRSVTWPRSTRTTRAAAEGSCPSSASSAVRRSSQPSRASAAVRSVNANSYGVITAPRAPARWLDRAAGRPGRRGRAVSRSRTFPHHPFPGVAFDG